RRSVSTNASPRRSATSCPTVVLPLPIKPMSATCRLLAEPIGLHAPQLLQVRTVVSPDLLNAVATELLQERLREFKGDHGFTYHHCSRNRTVVGPFDTGRQLFLRSKCDAR